MNNASTDHGGCREGLMVHTRCSEKVFHPHVSTLFREGIAGVLVGSIVVKIKQALGHPDVSSKPNSLLLGP